MKAFVIDADGMSPKLMMMMELLNQPTRGPIHKGAVRGRGHGWHRQWGVGLVWWRAERLRAYVPLRRSGLSE